jgi:flagellar hook-length control protein FliK
MSAKVAGKAGEKTGGKSLASSLMAAAAGLKGAGQLVQKPQRIAASAVRDAKVSGLTLPAGPAKAAEESEKPALGKDEKSDGRKKTVRLLASREGVTAEPGADTPRAVEGAARVEKHGDAVTAQATGAARSATTPRTVPIHIVDLRKRAVENSSASGSQKTAQASPAAKDPGTLFIPQPQTLKDVEAPRRPAPSAVATPQPGLERLREMAGSELIRASNLVLRDGGGEIRLVLKPESLGSVRIRMNLVDNKIEGRIIVDTSAVKQVIDQSIDALGRALTAGGFQTASLEVSVGGQNADNGRRMQEPPAEVRRVAAQGFERNIPGEESLSMGDLLVNLFV